MRIVDERGVGAPASFDEWFIVVWPRAFRLAAFMTHDAQAGEDVAQDVLFQMSRRWSSIERPDAYLQRALTNACRNWSRHSRIAESKLRLIVPAEATELAFDDLADAVARLPFRQRAVVVLRYYGDLSASIHRLGSGDVMRVSA